MPKSANNTKKKSPVNKSWRRFIKPLFVIAMTMIAFLFIYTLYLDGQIRQQFEGKRWSLPAKVYARPLELYPGKALLKNELLTELSSLQYFPQADASVAGSYADMGNELILHTRAFRYWDGEELQQRIQIRFSGQHILSIRNLTDELPRDLIRLDPVRIATIYPSHKEDRALLRLNQVPQKLVEALISIEDRDFYHHHGVSLRSIARAMLTNLRAGRMVQGGSTLTQQLVKNYFLSNERTLSRKLNEAIMSWLLDFHYPKDEILEAYFNEIYLGQDGSRAIHGIGMASQYYFGRTPLELGLEQQALLIAILNGPSYYNPRRFPERAIEKRNLILNVMLQHGLITPNEAEHAMNRPLGVLPKPKSSINQHPAFMDLVRRQLSEDYKEEDLRTEGLNIFTTLDPRVQAEAEQTVASELKEMERYYGIPIDTLQSAMVVTDTGSGEIQAVVGGRDPRFDGFNRAVDAQRHIGSLIKPVVFLTALQTQRYHLATTILDEPLEVELSAGQSWKAENYDHISHGEIPAYVALVNSYNQATLNLGMEIGVDQSIQTLRALGVDRPVNIYPSFLLGATEMSPLDVTQVYQTLANGGFTTPLRSIRAVLDTDGNPLQRYELQLKQAADPQAVYQVNSVLNLVTREGTARKLYDTLPQDLQLAGKTGTTNDLRDSWFAGFSGNRLAVVWLGRDDNKSAGFSGSTGAMRIWGKLYQQLGSESLELIAPEGISHLWLGRSDGRITDADCGDSVRLPFTQDILAILPVHGCETNSD